MKMNDDIIVAVATSRLEAAISIIRLSGKDVIAFVQQFFTGKIINKESHTITYGYIKDNGEKIDEVLVNIYRGKRTFTGEEMVEINCHGGVYITNKVVDLCLHHGARLAEPGEFTKRAFLNGRIDLSQAEAVIDVINAKSDMALESSLSQLRGSVKQKIEKLRKGIIGNIAFIEAALDDPEHIRAEGFGDELAVQVRGYMDELQRMLDSADNGRIIKEGIKTVILGKPNAGKSSLMNVLLGENRAIVTEIAGTTRDTLEENVSIHGIPLNIIDTAGIRQTEDVVEKIGVKKAIGFAEEADLIIYVVDSSTEMDQNDENIIRMIRDKKVIVLMNKSDLKPVVSCSDIEQHLQAPIIEISAREETGLDAFENTLKDMFFAGDIHYNDELCITNVRHKAAIAAALESLKMVMNSINDGMPEDFFSIDLMDAYEQLGHIIGEAVEDDLVDTIFSDFCMGK